MPERGKGWAKPDRRGVTLGFVKIAIASFLNMGLGSMIVPGTALGKPRAGGQGLLSAPPRFIAPGEEETHALTYMAFASDQDDIWTEPSARNAGLSWIRNDLMDVAKAIGTTEPVEMLVLNEADMEIARHVLETPSRQNPLIHQRYITRAPGAGGIELVHMPDGFNDYWMRDTAPVFARKADAPEERVAIGFNFNGWGNSNSRSRYAPASSNRTKAAHFFQPYERDQRVADLLARRHGCALVRSALTMEGGALELDGEGTAILTESSVLHVNRNPHLFDVERHGRTVTKAVLRPTAKAEVEAELLTLLGVSKVIWLSGTAVFPEVGVEEETDITNGHVDFYAKFLAPGIVAYALDTHDATGERALTLRHERQLNGQTDSSGRELKLVPLVAPQSYGHGLSRRQKENFAAGYINFYLCNGAIILPMFGDRAADAAARDAIAPHAFGRDIVQVDITAIGSGGGGLHCATMQVPAARAR